MLHRETFKVALVKRKLSSKTGDPTLLSRLVRVRTHVTLT